MVRRSASALGPSYSTAAASLHIEQTLKVPAADLVDQPCRSDMYLDGNRQRAYEGHRGQAANKRHPELLRRPATLGDQLAINGQIGLAAIGRVLLAA